MEWVSMAEQLLASLTSSTMPSVEWCKVHCDWNGHQKLTFLFGSLVGLPKCIVLTVESSGGGILVWGFFSVVGLGLVL